jgi:hypothetical protein
MIFDYKHYLNYFRLWDNRLIFGGSSLLPGDLRTIQRSAEILRAKVRCIHSQT